MSEIDIKRWEIVIKKIIRKKKVKLDNEIVISEIIFGMVYHGRPYEEFQKIPIYEFRLRVPITRH